MDEHIVLTLVTIAGLGATFAGFSGVVAVFDRRAQGEWNPEELFRLTNMLVMSLGAWIPASVRAGSERHERLLGLLAAALRPSGLSIPFRFPDPWRLPLRGPRHGMNGGADYGRPI
jgi:hypothetical protein